MNRRRTTGTNDFESTMEESETSVCVWCVCVCVYRVLFSRLPYFLSFFHRGFFFVIFNLTPPFSFPPFGFKSNSY